MKEFTWFHFSFQLCLPLLDHHVQGIHIPRPSFQHNFGLACTFLITDSLGLGAQLGASSQQSERAGATHLPHLDLLVLENIRPLQEKVYPFSSWVFVIFFAFHIHKK